MYKEPKILGNKREKIYLKTFLIAAFVSLAFFLPFLIMDRGIFLFYGDYNVQQIPFYQLAHRAIREGNIGFNLYTDLGVNFIGSYSFYLLGSPFFWLTIPFPNEALPYLMAPLFCLKFAVAATAAAAFIRRFVKNQNLAVVGGLLYAFSGFGIYNIFFNHFHEVIAFFPLILLSLELYIEEGKKGFFALSVMLCALCNYFFFFGEVVFVLIYFVIRTTTKKDKWQITFKKFLGIGFESVLGLCMSAILLLPSLITVLGNPRVNMFLNGWAGLVYGDSQRYLAILECLFFPPDIPARPNFFPDANAKWASLGAWLPLLGMCGVITFVQTHKKNFISKILGVSLIMSLVPILNSAFFAFNDAYYARWFFMPILFMALATVIALEKCSDEEFNTGIKASLAITCGFCLVGVFPKKTSDGWTFGLTPFPERFWAYVVIALVCILVTVLVVNVWRRTRYFSQILTGLVCLVTFVYSVAFIGMGKSHSYDEDFIIDQAIYGSENIKLDKKDDEFFRIDVYDGMDNLPMFWRLPSIQAFHSIVPKSTMDFYPEIGVERGVASRPEVDQYALRTLTSCKYLFIESNREEYEVCHGFELIGAQNGFDLYKNTYYVPMGWTYDKYCDESHYFETTESYRARLMLQAIVLSDEQINKYASTMVQLDDMSSILTKSNMDEDIAALRKGCADSFTETKTGFKSSITLDKANLVFYSIPYDEGWKAYINDKEVEVENVNRGFVAVYAPEGESQIEFVYHTPGLSLGIIITVVSAFVFVIYLIICAILSKKRKVFANDVNDIDFNEIASMVNESEAADEILSLNIHSVEEAEEKKDISSLDFRMPPQSAEELNEQSEKTEENE